MLKRFTMCCSVLQCVAVCCSVLRCVAAWRSVLQFVAVRLIGVLSHTLRAGGRH